MHLIKVAAYAAIAATAATACPGVVSGDCPPRLHKRSVIQLDDGQLTSGRGEAVKEIPDGQIIAGAMPRVQQAPDGQIVAPKIEGQEQVTTVVNVVTVTIPVEPFTRLITVTQSRYLFVRFLRAITHTLEATTRARKLLPLHCRHLLLISKLPR